jgi:hypothetical protein
MCRLKQEAIKLPKCFARFNTLHVVQPHLRCRSLPGIIGYTSTSLARPTAHENPHIRLLTRADETSRGVNRTVITICQSAKHVAASYTSSHFKNMMYQTCSTAEAADAIPMHRRSDITLSHPSSSILPPRPVASKTSPVLAQTVAEEIHAAQREPVLCTKSPPS